MKNDINKSAETSSKLLNDLIKTHTHMNNGQKQHNIQDSITEHPVVDLTNDFINEPLQDIVVNEDDYNYIDDTEIDNILNSIESEISRNDRTSKKTVPIPAMKNFNQNLTISQKNKIKTEIKNINTPTKDFNEPVYRGRYIKDSRKRKNINNKSNFSVIDLIEKKAKSDDGVISQSNDCGFSETIKCQVRNFLQRANKSELTSPEIYKGFSIKDCTELPVVHVTRNTCTMTSLSSQNIEEYLGSGGDNTVNSKFETKIPLNKLADHQDNTNAESHPKLDDIELQSEHINGISVAEISIEMPYVGIMHYNSDADNDINKTGDGDRAEIPKVNSVQVQEHNEQNSIRHEGPNYAVTKYIHALQDAEDVILDTEIDVTEKKAVPYQSSVSHKDKVGQSDHATYKDLIPYQDSKSHRVQPEIINNINITEFTENSTTPVDRVSLASSRLIYNKPIIMSNLPMIDKKETIEKILENKCEQVEIKKKPLFTYESNTEDEILPLNYTNVLHNRLDPKFTTKKIEKSKFPLKAFLIPHIYGKGVVENDNNVVKIFSPDLDLPDPLINTMSNDVTGSYINKVVKNTGGNMRQWHSPRILQGFYVTILVYQVQIRKQHVLTIIWISKLTDILIHQQNLTSVQKINLTIKFGSQES